LKILGIIATWVFVLCLPVLFFTASLAWGFNSLWLYKYGFQKYRVSQSTGLSESDLDKAARGLIRYFNSGEEYVHITVTINNQQVELFTEEEQIHFKDVKSLVKLDYIALLGTFLFVLVSVITAMFWHRGKYRRWLARSVVWGSGLSLGLLLVLGIAAVLDFDQLFLQLHYLIFSNLYWSAQGYMLMLFPEGFWNDAAFICIGFMVALAVICGAAASVYLWIRRKAAAPDLAA
jgi:integral membrane protein (TIGR01906 family)